MVVRGEGSATQTIAAVVITVNLLGHAEVELQFLVDDSQISVVPIERILTLDIDDAHCVVTPLGDSDEFTIR